MKIEDFLAPLDAAISVKATGKAQLLAEVAAAAARRLSLDPIEIGQELVKREELGSTGMGNGVAIPHARLEAVQRPFGVLWLLKRPIDFVAVDEKPVDIVFTLLLPGNRSGDQLNALACVARKLREQDRLQRMRSAANAAALYKEVVQ